REFHRFCAVSRSASRRSAGPPLRTPSDHSAGEVSPEVLTLRLFTNVRRWRNLQDRPKKKCGLAPGFAKIAGFAAVAAAVNLAMDPLFEGVKDLIASQEKFVLVTHINADGDGLG